MSNPTLGKSIAGAPVAIDVDRLVASRMLLTANSGGGKSWTLRRVLEQTHGRIQQLVIDPEGEFYTLREKHDLVLAAKGGDCPAEPRSAALLARRLLELGTSAILDLYELPPHDRVLFVRRFLESLISAPRDLWRPVLVVIDEAHTFAPENGHGEAESLDAVRSLMSQGRKRGFCGLLATQRLGKLSKDVAAEANNIWIGRMVLDVDVKRAAGSLGLTPREATTKLKNLEEGHGFAFGPALSRDVVELAVGPVHTTHPRAGQTAPPPTPPRDKVRKLLGQLADLPKEAAEEARTLADAKAQIKTLQRELTAAQKAQPEPKIERVEVPVLKPQLIADLNTLHARFAEQQSKLTRELQPLLEAISETWKDVALSLLRAGPVNKATASPANGRALSRPAGAPGGAVASSTRGSGNNGNKGNAAKLPKCERAILAVLAQHPDGCAAGKLTLLAGYRWSGGFRNSLGELRGAGLLNGANGDVMRITDAGVEALGEFDPLPAPGRELQAYWLGHASLGKCEREILTALIDAHPSGLEAAALAEKAGYQWSGGFRNSLSVLRTAGLIEGKNTEEMRASAVLFD